MKTLLSLPESALNIIVSFALCSQRLDEIVKLATINKYLFSILIQNVGNELHKLLESHPLLTEMCPSVFSYHLSSINKIFIASDSSCGKMMMIFLPDTGKFYIRSRIQGITGHNFSLVYHSGLLLTFSGEFYYDQVGSYNIYSNEWSRIASLPYNLSGCCFVSCGNAIYILGGESGGPDSGRSTNVLKLNFSQSAPVSFMEDIQFDVEVTSVSLQATRSLCGSAYYNNAIWLAGGKLSNDLSATNTVEIFDPLGQTCTAGPNMLRPRSNPQLLVIDEALYAVGGDMEEFLMLGVQSIEKYDVQKQAWVFVTFFLDPRRRGHCAVASCDKKIFIFGGVHGFSALHSWDYYDVRKHYWASQLQHNLQDAEKIVQSFQSHHQLTNEDVNFLINISLNFFDSSGEDIVRAKAVSYPAF